MSGQGIHAAFIVIAVNHLVKWYGQRCAVDHLDFTVEDGQVFGLLGPNGAGKSTTMNIMTGFLAASEGDVLIEGHSIRQEPEEAKRHLGYLPEQPPLYTDMTVGEYLRFCAAMKKLPKASALLDEAIALTHLDTQKGRLIGNLSKGYRQRVGLAQAILGFPKFIILDEPTVGLDPKQVVEIRELIRRLGQEHTVLLSSHILSEIRAVCDRVAILRKGCLVACDSPEALEEKLAGGGFTLTLRAEETEATQLFQSRKDIQQYTLLSHDGAYSTWNLSGNGQEIDREALFYACSEARCPIVELRSHHASLEEVFLDLTDEDDTVASRAARLLRGESLEEIDRQTSEISVESTSDASEQAVLSDENSCEETTEQVILSDENSGEETAEQVALPDENSTEETPEQAALSDKNSSEEATEQVVLSGENSGEEAEQAALPDENSTEETPEQAALSDNNSSEETTEQVVLSGENSDEEAEQVILPDENSGEVTTAGQSKSLDEELTKDNQQNGKEEI